MTRTGLSGLFAAAVIAAGASPGLGRIGGPIDLAKVVDKATVVVVAHVASVEVEERDGDLGHYVAKLDVLRALEGEPGPDVVEFRYTLDERGNGYDGLAAKTTRVIFLAPDADGRLAFVDPDHPSLPALEAAPAADGAPLARVVAELVAFLGVARENDEYGEGREVVEALAFVDEPAALDTLLAVARDAKDPNRFDALGALLNKNDLEALAIAEPLLAGSVPPDGKLEYVAHALMGIEDVRAIPALTRLLESPNAVVRTGAAYALRSTGSAAAEPALAKALYDTERDVRYNAVQGLAGLAGTDAGYAMAPSKKLYERDEEKYLRYWRAWAKRNVVE